MGKVTPVTLVGRDDRGNVALTRAATVGDPNQRPAESNTRRAAEEVDTGPVTAARVGGPPSPASASVLSDAPARRNVCALQPAALFVAGRSELAIAS